MLPLLTSNRLSSQCTEEFACSVAIVSKSALTKDRFTVPSVLFADRMPGFPSFIFLNTLEAITLTTTVSGKASAIEMAEPTFSRRMKKTIISGILMQNVILRK